MRWGMLSTVWGQSLSACESWKNGFLFSDTYKIKYKSEERWVGSKALTKMCTVFTIRVHDLELHHINLCNSWMNNWITFVFLISPLSSFSKKFKSHLFRISFLPYSVLTRTSLGRISGRPIDPAWPFHLIFVSYRFSFTSFI